MKKIFTFLVMLMLISINAQTIYSENFGSPSGTTNISAYTGWQNPSPPFEYTGTATLRTTSASSGYAGASGSGNVFFAAAGGNVFTISNINTSAYDPSLLRLDFGFVTSNSASLPFPTIVVEYSTDNGTTWSPLTVTANSNTSWNLKSGITGLPATSDLTLRFTGPASSGGMRIDDVKVYALCAGATFSAPVSSCDVSTLNLDKFTTTIPFAGGNTGLTYTITTSSTTVTIGGDSPTNTASGNIVITNAEEGKDYTVTIFNGTCATTIQVVAPSCKPINTLPVNEPFNYTAGTSLGEQQMWKNINSGDEIIVKSGSLSYSGITSTANSVEFSGAGFDTVLPFDKVTTGSLYTSFLVSVTDYSNVTTDLNGTYFAVMTDAASSNTTARIYIRNNGSQYQYGIGTGTAISTATWSPNLYNVGTVQYLTLAYNFDTNSLQLFENNTSTASLTVSPETAITEMGGFQLRQDGAAVTPTMTVDELRISSTMQVLSISEIMAAKSQYLKNTMVENELFFQTKGKASVKVFNANGQLVKSADITPTNAVVNVSNLPKGMYIVTTETAEEKVAQKFMKK